MPRSHRMTSYFLPPSCIRRRAAIRRASPTYRVSAKPALRSAHVFEQRKILHVARADLDAVAVFFDQIDAALVHRFGHDVQTELIAHLSQDLQAVFAFALKIIRRSARFKSAAAKKFGAAFATASAASKTCSTVSTAQGPAIIASSPPPIVALPIWMTDFSGSFQIFAREISLYCFVTRWLRRRRGDFQSAGRSRGDCRSRRSRCAKRRARVRGKADVFDDADDALNFAFSRVGFHND